MNILIGNKWQLLTDELGRGGAGIVYAHPHNPKIAIKIYTDASQDCEAQRIDALCANPPADLWERRHPTHCWPLEPVFDGATGDMCGFSMYRVRKTLSLSGIIYPSARLFPISAAWLWKVAISFLKRLQTIHLHTPAHIAGDINPENFHVSRQAIVTQLDLDSTHFVDPVGITFTTKMNRWEFQPPELLEAQLPILDRGQDQDAWSAYTMVYRLLREGEHPYDFVYRGGGKRPNLQQVIREEVWPQSLRNPLLKPKPSTAPYSSLPPQLQELFRRMFLDGQRNREKRPDVSELLACLQLHQSRLTCGASIGRITWQRGLRAQSLGQVITPHDHWWKNRYLRAAAASASVIFAINLWQLGSDYSAESMKSTSFSQSYPHDDSTERRAWRSLELSNQNDRDRPVPQLWRQAQMKIGS